MPTLSERTKEVEFRLTGCEQCLDNILHEKIPQIRARMTRIEDAGVNLDRRMTKLALKQEIR